MGSLVPRSPPAVPHEKSIIAAMEGLQGAAVRVTPERGLADEWAVVLTAVGIPHRLRRRPDGWALIVAPLDARAAIDAFDGADLAQQSRSDITALRGVHTQVGHQALCDRHC